MENLISVGVVTDCDTSSGRVRVYLPDEDLTTGWLGLLQSSPELWTPGINVLVALVILPGGDGFVLGKVRGGGEDGYRSTEGCTF